MDLREAKNVTHRHPWEMSRGASLLHILKEGMHEACYADIGSGDLFFAKKLKQITPKQIYAVDINYKSLGKKDNISKLKNLSSIPRKSVDCVLLLDVLEHIKDDEGFVGSLLEILKEEGVILITVPAYQFLYSGHDMFLKHFRRYRKKNLIKILKKYNLTIKEDFYFYTVLFFTRCLQLALTKCGLFKVKNQGIGNWRFSKRHLLTLLITNILNIDFFINRTIAKLGISFGGLSICVVAQKERT